ncbi:MAG: hypothetical protein SFV21_10910 [Rhodospirillaceae bacterium]|nr:hypothetical protein [Rhodospirillaceae bacterium]
MKWPDLPKRVAIATAVIVGFLVVFVALYFTLGSARDDAVVDNQRLKSQLASTEANLRQAVIDVAFAVENNDRYVALMAGDKMIPHARRAAVVQLQQHARVAGLTTLNYNFRAASALSPTTVANQPQARGYRVNVEDVELTLGAPLDGMIYRFVDAITQDFPGTIVLHTVELERAPVVTEDSLNQVARGRESNLVKGKAVISWRTAQEVEPTVSAAGSR